jgi:LysR family transcriptional regulator, regulator of abg operon
MKLNQLRDFIAVAHAGGLRAAARKSGLGQPALSKSIRQLEAELEAPLFERNARGTALTPFGKAFLARAQAAANELGRAREELDQLRGGTGGTVAFGSSSIASLLFLPEALKTFRRKFPQADVRIVEGAYPGMLPELRNGSLDFIVGPRPSEPPGKEFRVEKLFDNRRTVVARHGHPLANAKSLKDLAKAEWAVTLATGVRASECEDIFAAHHLPAPSSKVQCESMLALLALIANSDLLAFLPPQWVESPLTRTALREIRVSEVIEGPATCVIRRTGLPLTPAAEALASAFERETAYYQRIARTARA